MNGPPTVEGVAPPGLALRQRILRAGSWSLAGYAVGQGIRFGTNLLMTRLLVPEMFGVMSIALMVMTGLALLSDIGLRMSVVQNRRGAEPLFLDTVWVTRIGCGALIAGGAALVAIALHGAAHAGVLPSDSAYAAPQLPWVLAALGAAAIVSGAESTKTSEASRRLALARITQVHLIGQVVAVVAMLCWAWFDRSIWVLVAGSVASTVTATTLSHVWLPGHSNRIRWDRTVFREVFSFGKWVLVSSVLGFFANAGDKLWLGVLVSANVLGIYSIAFLLMNAVESVLTKIIGDVTFPALSEVARERRGSLSQVLYQFYKPLWIFNFSAALVLAYAAPLIVGFLYDDRYKDAGWILQSLALGLLGVPSRMHAICLLALGHANWHSHIVLVRLIVMCAGVPLGFALMGLEGAVWAVVAAYLSVIPASLYFSSRLGLTNPRVETVIAAASSLLIVSVAVSRM